MPIVTSALILIYKIECFFSCLKKCFCIKNKIICRCRDHQSLRIFLQQFKSNISNTGSCVFSGRFGQNIFYRKYRQLLFYSINIFTGSNNIYIFNWHQFAISVKCFLDQCFAGTQVYPETVWDMRCGSLARSGFRFLRPLLLHSDVCSCSA